MPFCCLLFRRTLNNESNTKTSEYTSCKSAIRKIEPKIETTFGSCS